MNLNLLEVIFRVLIRIFHLGGGGGGGTLSSHVTSNKGLVRV